MTKSVDDWDEVDSAAGAVECCLSGVSVTRSAQRVNGVRTLAAAFLQRVRSRFGHWVTPTCPDIRLPRILVLAALLPGVIAHAAPMHYDDVIFEPPGEEWIAEPANGDHLTFTHAATEGVKLGQITIYKSRDATGSPEQEFETDWRQHILPLGRVNALAPVMVRAPFAVRDAMVQPTGGGAQIYVMLVTFVSHQRGISLILRAQPFAASPPLNADLKKIMVSLRFAGEAEERAVPAEPARSPFAASKSASTATFPVYGNAPNRPTSIVGSWQRTTAVLMSIVGPFLSRTSGYFRTRYVFNADGTYRSTREQWFGYERNEYYLAHEAGRYTLVGNTLTLTPQFAEWQLRDKKVDGPVKKSGKGKLQPATYQASWLNILRDDPWYLLLQTPEETERDGSFSTSPRFPHSYEYQVPTPAETAPTEF